MYRLQLGHSLPTVENEALVVPHQVVPLAGFDVAPLVAGLGRQNLLAEITLPPAVNQAAERHFGVGRDHAQIAVQVAVVERSARLDQVHVVFEDARGADHIGLFAVDLQRVV